MNIVDHIDVNPEAGSITWKPRPREFFTNQRQFMTWNARYAGKSVGCVHYKNGKPIFVGFKFGRKLHLVHRVLWEVVNGPIPVGIFIDHENCDPTDNRMANLRLATHTQNRRNSRIQSNNTSGFKGVCWVMRRGTWQARIGGVSLGQFATKELAHQAYCEAAKVHHGQFARTA